MKARKTGTTVPDTENDVAGILEQPPDGYRAGFVALTGRPNVGKSTLLNALVGETVAIASRRPQTTRRRILGIRTTDTAQMIFVDTPGIHRPRTPLAKYMVEVARGAIPDADVVVWVVDVAHLPDAMDRSIAEWIRRSNRPAIIAMNKSDHLRPDGIETHTVAYNSLLENAEWTFTIAVSGHNLDRLAEMIESRLPPGPHFFPADQLTDQTDRMLATEMVREAALHFLGDEVPHGVEVVLEEWTRRANGNLYLLCTLIVERATHKPIVLGAGGAMIRQIGSRARRNLEKLLDCRTYLDLHVAVRPDWRRDPDEVRRLGYQ